MTVSRAPTLLSALFALSFSSATAQVNPSPRPAYWQQGVRYEINARLDESRFELAGTEMIEYVNNSPDTLSTFSLHLYLNAFRPGSRWSDADSVERKRRFNDLKDPDYAYNHVRNVRIMGETVEPIYPFAPDSTIVRFELPRPLPPGGSTQVGCPSFHSPAPTGAPWTGVRLCAVVSQGRGLRQTWLGGTSALPGRRILR
jgi:hypothetical protein